MNTKGFISDIINGTRIVSGGKIGSLTEAFSLPHGTPFTIYIRPKNEVDTVDTVLSVMLYQQDGFVNMPFLFYDWSPLCITEIAANSSLLSAFDIYWGSGSCINHSLV
jgi:hypothetical protein